MSEHATGHFLIFAGESEYYADDIVYSEGFAFVKKPVVKKELWPNRDSISDYWHNSVRLIEDYGVMLRPITLGANGVKIHEIPSPPSFVKIDKKRAKEKMARKIRVIDDSLCKTKAKRKFREKIDSWILSVTNR